MNRHKIILILFVDHLNLKHYYQLTYARFNFLKKALRAKKIASNLPISGYYKMINFVLDCEIVPITT